ncbi:MAG: response regulator [Proteobacteria bacterium]|nr:response regulator [Pseudomonadota bacterium]MBU1451266.1 response regulator [Pseudomonadota bacterium]MBU2470298.1 response regulator [Pseudomonadota bacterium]MBU2517205.1 response regulator [Pseudomonadota bacterium]
MRTSHKIIALALFSGILLWFVDSLVDYLWFYQGTFWGLLITAVPPHELYIRLLILAFFLGFGILAGRMVERLRRTEAELTAGRQWLATTLSSIGDAVIATDRQGRVSFMNPTAAGLTGWTPSEASGRPLGEVFKIINEHTLRPAADPVQKVLASGTVAGLANHTLLMARDGRRLPIEDSGAPIKNQRGEVDGVVLVFRDISRRRRAEQERARLDAQLRQSQKLEAIGTLAGGIAHDFNNSLGVIMGYSELALRNAHRGKTNAADLEQVLAVSRRAQSLVRQIMTYSRRGEPQMVELDLNQVVQEVAELLRRTLPKMFSVELDLEPGLEAMRGDPVQMEQVLINLANNARDAMPRGGRLLFGTASHHQDSESTAGQGHLAPGRYLRLTVGDQGQGMDPATRARIFEPLFTTKEPGQGTGLGLSTVYGIVKSHGGHIDCHSQPGRGASFELYFPLDGGSAQPARGATCQEAAGGSESILIVDDEAAIQLLGRRVLSEAGYQVALASSGEEALELYRGRAGGFDLVFLDVNMPGIGGLGCLARLRELSPGLKVVVVSGYLSPEVVEEITVHGVQGYVTKPFLNEELLGSVRAALDLP